MRVYVAGRFREYERIRAVIDLFKEDGHEITHDWTRTDEFNDDGTPRIDPNAGGAELSRDRQIAYAWDDLNGVFDCDAVVLIGNEKLCGSLIEVGAALALQKAVIVVDHKRWTIFYSLEQVRTVPDLEAARRLLRKYTL